MQLDLFNDSEPARLERLLAGALCAWDVARARALLEHLRELAEPGARLADLATLVQGAAALDCAGEAPARLWERLERDLLPASRVLGSRAGEFQAATWQRLARALEGCPFDPVAPRLHASYAALRAADWKHLRQAVEAEAGWREQPTLLARRLRAAEELGEDVLAGELMCRLCWEFPGSAAEMLRDDPRFGPWFGDFSALDTDLRPPAFPAWYALSLGRRLPLAEDAGAAEGREMLEAVHGVLAEAPGEPDLAARRRLQRASPELCRMYLARRDVRGSE